MPVSFSKWSGPYELDDRWITTASAAIDVGDALENNTELQTAESGDKIAAVALEAKASSDATTDPIQYMVVYPGRTKFFATRESGTLAQADEKTKVDLASPDGINADVTTNGDCFVYARLDADSAVILFSEPGVMGPA